MGKHKKRKLDPPGQRGNKFSHTEMSDVACATKGCPMYIKLNVVARKTGDGPLYCRRCGKARKIKRQSGRHHKYVHA